MYAPMYLPPGAYQQPTVHDPYFMGQPGVIYAPQYVDTAYGSRMVQNPRTGSPSRKTSDAYQPELLRPSVNRRGSQWYTSSTRSSFSHVLSPQRTERAFSAGPAGGFQPSITTSVLLSPINNNNNPRKRGMSHPPISKNRRHKSHSTMKNPTGYSVSPAHVPVVSMHHTTTTRPYTPTQHPRRGISHTKDESGLHKYFQ